MWHQQKQGHFTWQNNMPPANDSLTAACQWCHLVNAYDAAPAMLLLLLF